MATALGLARRGLGVVWPNPAVGCVLVRPDGSGRVVGRGWTQPGGRPHAESVALRRAGTAARGATAYVSLEPCDHHAATPPCSQALIDAGIARAVVAVEDPDPRVAGKGLARMRGAGIAVDVGIGAQEARRLNAGFFLRVGEGRPLFTLKLAASLDGRIATGGGDSRWITGPVARAHAHRLRSEHDGILIGRGTALRDRPRLNCRLPGLAGRSPIRIVCDSTLALPVESPLVATAKDTPTWVATVAPANAVRRDALQTEGVEVMEMGQGPDGRVSLPELARVLGARGLTRVLVEGGGLVAAGFLGAGFVDEIAWFQAPILLGADGAAAIAPLGVETVAAAIRLLPAASRSVGVDRLQNFIQTART